CPPLSLHDALPIFAVFLLSLLFLTSTRPSLPWLGAVSGVPLGPVHGLFVQPGEAPLRVVDFLELGREAAAVELLEGLPVVEGLGVEGLVPAKGADLLLDELVECAGGGVLAQQIHGHGGPEADVDPGLPHRQRVERLGVLLVCTQGLALTDQLAAVSSGALNADWAKPHRLDLAGMEEPLEELGQVLRGDLDVLDHALAGRPIVGGLDAVGEVVFAVPADDLPVEAGAQQVAGPHAADRRVLATEGAASPEPVHVPAPQVVANAQPVAEYAFGVLNRAVVDPVAGVIAGRARFVGLPSEHEVALLQAEHGAVEVVHRFAVVFPRLDD